MRGLSRDFRVQLGIVVLVALVIRVWAVLAWQRFLELAGDQVYYHFQGRALAEGAGFVNPWAWNTTGDEIATALHPPLYSAFLGGASLVGASGPTAHKLASALLGAATVLVVGVVARRLAGQVAGVAAAVAAAVYPNLWVNDTGLAAESLYALLVAVTLLVSYRLWREPSTANAALFGAVLGLAALARAEALVLFAVLAVPLAIVTRGTVAERLRLLGVTVGVGAFVLAPWVVRNLTTFEHPVVLSNGAGFVFEIANCDATYAGELLGYWSVECDRAHTWIYDSRIEAARHESTVERAKREEGLGYVSDHLSRLPVVVTARVGRMWEVFRPGQGIDLNSFFERRGRLPSQVGLAQYYLMLPLAVAGLVVLRRRVTIVPFVALAVSVTITAAVSFGITRYRVGADVALTVLAGVAIGAAWEGLRRRRLTRGADREGPTPEAAERVPVGVLGEPAGERP